MNDPAPSAGAATHIRGHRTNQTPARTAGSGRLLRLRGVTDSVNPSGLGVHAPTRRLVPLGRARAARVRVLARARACCVHAGTTTAAHFYLASFLYKVVANYENVFDYA